MAKICLILLLIFISQTYSQLQPSIVNITVSNSQNVNLFSPFNKEVTFTFLVSFSNYQSLTNNVFYNHTAVTYGSTVPVVLNNGSVVISSSTGTILITSTTFFTSSFLCKQPMTLTVYTTDGNPLMTKSIEFSYNSPYYEPLLEKNTYITSTPANPTGILLPGLSSWNTYLNITVFNNNIYNYIYFSTSSKSNFIIYSINQTSNQMSGILQFNVPTQISNINYVMNDISPRLAPYTGLFSASDAPYSPSFSVLNSSYGSTFYIIVNNSKPIGAASVLTSSGFPIAYFTSPSTYFKDAWGYYSTYLYLPKQSGSVTISVSNSQNVIITTPFQTPQVQVAASFFGLGNTILLPNSYASIKSGVNNIYGFYLTFTCSNIQLVENLKIYTLLGDYIYLSNDISLYRVANQTLVVPVLPEITNIASVITIAGKSFAGGSFTIYPGTSSTTTPITNPIVPTVFLGPHTEDTFIPLNFNLTFSLLYVDQIINLSGSISYGLSINNIILPKKQIPYEFPFECQGYSSDMIYQTQIPVLPDSPKSTLTVFLPNNTVSNVSLKFSNIISDNVDLLPPIAMVSITYDKEFLNSSKSDFLRVDITDKIGVDNDRCLLTYGPYKIPITSQLRFKGSNTGSQSYITQFKMNRYFCDEDIKFQCEDLRGNILNWSMNMLGDASSNFMNKIGSCISPLNGVKVIGIKSYDVYLTPLYKKGFQVDLFSPLGAGDLINYGVQLYLDDAITGTNLYSVNLTFTNLTTGHTGVAQFTNTLTQNCNYRLLITYQSKSIEILNSELIYMSSFRKNNTLETTIQLVEPTFTGFPYYASFFYFNNVGSSYSLSLTGANFSSLDTIYYTTISSINPYPVTRSLKYISNVSSYQLMQTPIEAHRVYIDSICDIKNNCLKYPSFAFSTINPIPSTTVPVTKILMSTATAQLTAIPSTIDVTSINRKVQFNFTLAPTVTNPFTLSNSYQPILYIVEKVSMARLKVPMTPVLLIPSLNIFLCDFEIPLNWGVNGVLKLAVYNVLSTNGQFAGYEFTNGLEITSNNNIPVIWSTFIDTSLPNLLYINGSNLGFTELPEHSLSIIQNGKPFLTALSYIAMTPTTGYVQLSSSLTFQFDTYLSVKSNPSKLISLFVLGCMNPTCSGQGTCQNGQCQCNSGWGGVDCSINTSYQCKGNCSGQGECVMMNCNCYAGFMGPICETKIIENKIELAIVPNITTPVMTFNQFTTSTPSTSTTTTTSASGTTTSTTEPSTNKILSQESKNTNFTVLLTKIEEISYQETPVKSFNLLGKWNLQSFNSTTYVYTMPLGQSSMLTTIVEMTGSESKTIEFANSTITIPQNSIKYYIKVENYTFQSSLNHLTFSWEANYKVPNPCETKAQKMTYGGSNLNDIHYIMIPANQLKLYGRFSNLIIVDDRILLSSNQAQVQNDKVTIKVNTPFFTKQVELDPDFSVLVDYGNSDSSSSGPVEYDDQCNPISKSKSKSLPKYAIPVIIAVSSFIGVILLVGFFALLYKKNFAFRMGVLSAKQTFRTKSSKKSFTTKLDKM